MLDNDGNGSEKKYKNYGSGSKSSGNGYGGKPFKKRKSRFYEAPDEPLTETQKARVLRKMENICLWYIAKSRKTRKELYDRLRERRYPTEFIEIVLDKLEAQKDIDDAAYAEYFAYSRHNYERYGKRAIENKLRQKGVDGEIIAAAVENLDMEEEEENAQVLVERKLRYMRNLDEQKKIQRLLGFLVRKGYDMGTALRIVKEAVAADKETAELEAEEEN